MFEDKSDSDSDDKKTLAEINARDELRNPYWIESPDLKDGPMGQLDKPEELFFKVCILLFAAVVFVSKFYHCVNTSRSSIYFLN